MSQTQRFSVVGELGSGGQGRVLAVRDAARGGAVLALKETPSALRSALQREFGLLARLRHPNLVAVYDWFRTSPLVAPGMAGDDGLPAAYTQELVEGVDLWRALRGAGQATQERVLEQVLSALAYLHALDVVHLDLKPENVMVTRADGGALARVLDFGIARPIGGAIEHVQGSFSYIAPEVLLRGSFDQRADLYAFGVMMVEVATGRPPNPADLRGPLADVDARRAAFDALGMPASWLDASVMLCDPDPRKRPANAQAAAALWGLGRRESITLVTPATVQAIVRAGPPVGQDHVIAAAERLLAVSTETPHGGALLITGGPGSGRNTSLGHLARLAQTQGHPVEWWPHGRGMRQLRAFGETLARLLGTESLSPLVQRSASVWVEGGRVDSSGAAVASLDGLASRVAAEVVKAICLIPGASPLPVLAVDGIDAGPALVRRIVLGLIEAAQAGGTLPLVVIATTSTVQPGVDSLALAPLDVDSVETFLSMRFGRHDLSRRLSAALVVASAGQPLRLETLLGLVAARGDLQLGVDGWEWHGGADTLVFPHGASTALQQRLALLEPAARAVLAAVAWCRFPASATTAAAALDQETPPLRTLLELESAGLLWRDADGRFRLAHPGLEDVLAASGEMRCAPFPDLLERRIREASLAQDGHARGRRPLCGRADLGFSRPKIENPRSLLDDRPAPDTPRFGAAAHQRVIAVGGLTPLANAWHSGGETGAQSALALARVAWAGGDADAAADALDVALELTPDAPDVLRLRADVANLLGPRDLQIACLERLTAGLTHHDPARLDALAALFWTLTRVGDVTRAMATGQAVVALARTLGEKRVLAEVLVHLAIALTQRGDYDEGETHLAEARTLVDPTTDPGLTARIENNLGNIFAYREQSEAALAHYTAAHALKTREGDPVGVRIAVGNMGLMCLRLGRSTEAMQHFSASYAAAKRTGHRRGLAWSLCALSELGLDAGAWTYAVRRAQGALSEADALGDRLIACDAETTLAEATLALGQVEQAAIYARSGLQRAVAANNGYTAARARLILAMTQHAAPAAEFRAIATDAQADDTTRARAWSLAAEAELVGGDLQAAREAAQTAAELATVPAVLASVWQTYRRLGEPAGAADTLVTAQSAIAVAALSWPDEPAMDGVERVTATDSPSRATYHRRADVALLRTQTAPPPRHTKDALVTELPNASDASASTDDPTAALLQGAAAADRAQLSDRLGQALDHWVQTLGAERAFIVSGERVLLARDADAERITDAEKKLPSAAVEGALRTGQLWRAADASGRGTLAAVPIAIQTGEQDSTTVVVFQNRFVADAFETLDTATPPVALPLLIRMMLLHDALTAAHKRADDAEAQRRSAMTRSTEEILMLRRELESTREQLGPNHSYTEIVFTSASMRKMLRQVDRIVETDLPVHIHGESGTGKELVARAVHANGARSGGPFVAQNCSAIPHDLFESEFFGHEKGAFTGASRATDGLFRRASGGTLFLDEIGDLPLSLQSKLLRVLETSEVRPVGGSRTFRVDVRIISATHHDLKALVDTKAFREDLFYRLNVLRVAVPALRERPDDVALLAEHFLAAQAAGAHGRDPHAITFGQGVMKALIAYGWPGNVRQLENEITRAALLAEGGVIEVDDLSPEIRHAKRGGTASDGGEAVLGRLGLDRGTLKDRVDRLERHLLSAMLEATGGNKSQVARELGLSRAGLNMKLKRLDLWERA